MTMLVGILMMRSFMDWLQRLLQYPLDVIVISSWRRNHARHQTVWLSVFSLLAKCFVCVHFLLLEGLDFALHGCFYILLHQLTVGFILSKDIFYCLYFIFLTNLMIAVCLHQVYLFLWSTDLDTVNSFFCIILIL